MIFSQVGLFAAANSTTYSLNASNGLIAIAVKSSVFLASAKSRGQSLHQTCTEITTQSNIQYQYSFNVHSANIQCLKVLPLESRLDDDQISCIICGNSGKSFLVVCGLVDGAITVSKVNEVISNVCQFSVSSKILLPKYSSLEVNCLDLFLFNNKRYVLSCSSDSKMKVSEICLEDLKTVHEFSFQNQLPLVCKAHVFLERVFAFVATEDCKVSVLIVNPDFSNASIVHKLIGFSDWIRDIDVFSESTSITVAAASQDATIRLWKIANFESGAGDTLVFQANSFQVPYEDSQTMLVSLETILRGHTGKIYSVEFDQSHNYLLSASFDKTIILWNFSHQSNSWTDIVRVGQIGGNTLGFMGARFISHAPNISFLGHSFGGGLSSWIISNGSSAPLVCFSGHNSAVKGLAWSSSGAYLFSVGKDKTTRVFAPIHANGDFFSWYEMARPQIHGYDMAAIAALSDHRMVSASDEKVLRVFQCSTHFVDNLSKICSIKLHSSLIDSSLSNVSALVPALGLTNKILNSEDSNNTEDVYIGSLDQPPSETHLCQNTLWQEQTKLYGHGYDVVTLCASQDGRLIASAAKASRAADADILVWEVTKESVSLISRIEGHNLTVTGLAFSPCSNFLLSVSRDRSWRLVKINKQDEISCTFLASNNSHKRVIWDCCWISDSSHFITASRDKSLRIWKINHCNVGSNSEIVSSTGIHTFNEAITACDARLCNDRLWMIAVGLENGLVMVLSWNPNAENNPTSVIELDQPHYGSVNCVRFKPQSLTSTLATCGEDNSVRIFQELKNS